ncbi:MAG TPA: hypothetical protein VK021_09410 [Flavobacteriaceae bacterium]|nr:hypothetical protein [Flavobacteriaceae bacterium]
MRKFYLLSILLTVSFLGYAQKLNLDNLENLLVKRNFSEIHHYLSGTKWEYGNSEDGEAENEREHIWRYDKSFRSTEPDAFLILYTYNITPEMVALTTSDKNIYDSFESEIHDSNYEKYDKEYENKIRINYYQNSKYYIRLIKNEDNNGDFNEAETQYIVVIRKRGGFYDHNNGAKKVFYDDGTLKRTYHLTNGKLSGFREDYYPNGKLKLSAEYKNDMAHGSFTQYFYGDEDEFKDKLLLKKTGRYYNDKKDGEWKMIYLFDDNYKTIQLYTYDKGVKSGPFQDFQGDSLIIGNYKMDKLDGRYKIYDHPKNPTTGNSKEIDTTSLKLLTKGYYVNGNKSGHWWINNIYYIEEGDYFNDKKTGQWDFSFTKEMNTPDEKYPFAGELAKTENFKNGRLNGLTTQYWFVGQEERSCTEAERQSGESEPCYEINYRKALETSYYKHGKLDGLYELKDKNGNIVRKGYYVNGVKDGGWIEGEFEEDTLMYKIESKGFYNRGIKEGDWSETETIQIDFQDEPLVVTSKGQYVNDSKNGEWKRYDNTNFHFETVNYKNNKLDGKSTSWDNDLFREVKIYEDGELVELSKYEIDEPEELRYKYEIKEDTYAYKNYVKYSYFEDGHTTQEFSIDKGNSDYDINTAAGTFLSAPLANPLYDSKGFKYGMFKKYDKDGKLIKSGEYFKENKKGTWIEYFHEQNVQLEIEYKNNKPSTIEKYVEINSKNPFSGNFIFIDSERNLKEDRRIRNGYRQGRTKIYNLKTDKLIKRERYRTGVLR